MAAAVPEDSTVVKKTVLRMVTLDVCLGLPFHHAVSGEFVGSSV